MHDAEQPHSYAWPPFVISQTSRAPYSEANVCVADRCHKSAIPPTRSGDVGSYADFRKFPSGCSHRATGEESVWEGSKIWAGLVVLGVGCRKAAWVWREPLPNVVEPGRRSLA